MSATRRFGRVRHPARGHGHAASPFRRTRGSGHQRLAGAAQHPQARRSSTLTAGFSVYGLVLVMALAASFGFVAAASRLLIQALGSSPLLPELLH
jgi:hypothetical protein